MSKRAGLKVLIVALYLSFIVLFFKFANWNNKDIPESYECRDASPCLRFCDIGSVNDSMEVYQEITNKTNNLLALSGYPCKKMKVLVSEMDEWKFLAVSSQKICECRTL